MLIRRVIIVEKEDFIKEIISLTPDEMRDIINKNGKGPKPIQLVCRIESGVENNTQATEM
jgi:hypothetical protein